MVQTWTMCSLLEDEDEKDVEEGNNDDDDDDKEEVMLKKTIMMEKNENWEFANCIQVYFLWEGENQLFLKSFHNVEELLEEFEIALWLVEPNSAGPIETFIIRMSCWVPLDQMKVVGGANVGSEWLAVSPN